MKLRLFFTTLTSLALIIVFAACSTTEYYKDRAVQRARVFLLQEDRTLTLAQQEYVKFNKPVIMAAPIFTKLNSASATSGTLSHVCIGWIVPGRKDAYVVFGASDNRLRDWTPNRVIIKRYDQPARIYHKAKSIAVSYGVNNFLYLSSQQINRIRFEVPETIITDYKFSKATLKAKGLSESQLKSLVQITFVWPSSSYDKRLFVCGLGAKDLVGWQPVFGGETSVDELRKHFIGSLPFGQFASIQEDGKQVNNKIKELPVIEELETVPKTEKPKTKEPELKPEVKEPETVPKAEKLEVKKPEVKPKVKEPETVPKAENPEVKKLEVNLEVKEPEAGPRDEKFEVKKPEVNPKVKEPEAKKPEVKEVKK